MVKPCDIFRECWCIFIWVGYLFIAHPKHRQNNGKHREKEHIEKEEVSEIHAHPHHHYHELTQALENPQEEESFDEHH